MKTAIIIHGMPSEGDFLAQGSTATTGNWLPWIKSELEKNGFEVFMPEMPVPYNPSYEMWAEEFERLPLTTDTTLVGHSAGAGFLLRWLSENKFRVGKVVLVAPWLDPNSELTTGMFDFEIDGTLIERTARVTVFISSDDDQEMHTTLEVIQSELPGVEVKQFTDKGHFIFEHTHSNEFPELLEELLQ